jgi:hypothetical protein
MRMGEGESDDETRAMDEIVIEREREWARLAGRQTVRDSLRERGRERERKRVNKG